MQKLLSIGLSFLILLQSIDIQVDDIVQLDELIEHAQFHKQEYGDSFFVFLSKHYGEQKAEHSKKHQEEKKDHEQLPFQNHFHVCGVPVFVLKQEPLQIEGPFIEIESEKADNFYYQMPHTSLFKSGLFQPPRHA